MKALKELIGNFVIRPKGRSRDYMFYSYDLRKVRDGGLYVRRLVNRNPSSTKLELPTLDWNRQAFKKQGQPNHLQQAHSSPLCNRAREDLRDGGFDAKEEVIFPINDLTLWRECLGRQGLGDKDKVWYRNYILFDFVELTTGSIIEIDGTSYHDKAIDSARDDYVLRTLGRKTFRFPGYGGGGPKGRIKSRGQLYDVLGSQSDSSYHLWKTIREANVEAAIEFYLKEKNRDTHSIPILLYLRDNGFLGEKELVMRESTLKNLCSSYDIPYSKVLTEDLVEVVQDLYEIKLTVIQKA